MRMDPATTVADALEEAGELVNRFAPKEALGGTWERNLELLSTLAVVHATFHDKGTPLGTAISEEMWFARAAFEMGRAAERAGT